jgi:hypothetical protein
LLEKLKILMDKIRTGRYPQKMEFTPNLAMLPPPQRRLWPELASTPEMFTLYRGTALALRLGHRASVDFDFFSNAPCNPDRSLPAKETGVGGSVVERGGDTSKIFISHSSANNALALAIAEWLRESGWARN